MSPMVKLPLSMEYALLGFLRDEPSYPYQVHQRLEQTPMLHLVWQIKQRQTYALLERLEEAGFLESSTVVQGRRPPRRMVQLTERGRAMFAEWLVQPVAHGRAFRQEFMAKLYFAQHAGAETVGVLITRQRAVLSERLDAFKKQLAALSGIEPLDRLVIQFRIGQLDATLHWLDQCEATLCSGPLT
jgi:PadR family transcriptional regulator, regulatory protein AphA